MDLRHVGNLFLPTRLKLAKVYIFPILDYGSALHPRIRRADETLVTKADKAAFACVLGVQPTTSFPSAKAMAHELGELCTFTRWRLQSHTFATRIQLHPSHSSSVAARNLFTTVHARLQKEPGRQLDVDTFGPGALLLPPSMDTRAALLYGPQLGPLLVAARSLPIHPTEVIQK